MEPENFNTTIFKQKSAWLIFTTFVIEICQEGYGTEIVMLKMFGSISAATTVVQSYL